MLQKVLSQMRRCCEDYDMIRPGDRIAVGVSGGKDSLVTLTALAAMRRFYPAPYEVEAITIDPGIEGMEFSAVTAYCESLGVEHTVIKTHLKELIFDIRHEKNPCSLCAKMRRGALNEAAVARGCRKIALGHNRDDAVETLVMSQIYEGRLSCFFPVTYLSRADVTVIRPLLYVPEKMVRSCAKSLDLPIVTNPCPANGNTKRQFVKELIAGLNKEAPGLQERLFGAMQRLPLPGWGRTDNRE
jgi:tRNA(Ile)-lysidine synthase TilS/MesJ